jgi:hypothetical protein
MFNSTLMNEALNEFFPGKNFCVVCICLKAARKII